MILAPEIAKAGAPKLLPVLDAKRFDLEAVLPLSTIRIHTKADDVVRVPDALLSIYRNAAFQAAEAYTGMLLREQRIVYQDASHELDIASGHKWRSHVTINLDYPSADGVLYLYGGKALMVTTIMVPPGSTKIKVPVNHYALDMTQCCGDPCGKRPANSGMTLMYRAGLDKCEDVPACIIMGCLKYLAWTVNNPGDEALRDTAYADTNPQAGGNNAAWRSGAIEEWRLCTRDY